jgi:cellulose synthase/poly-beta-1,6-N-acetylglucosamine synthase-like glycosyltransferase
MLGVALAALFVLAYTYVGYPALVGVLARIVPDREPLRDPTYEPTVTVCMPVYNAEAYLAGKLESLLSQDYPESRLDVLVFSDGSTDKSDAITEGFARSSGRVRIVRSESRVGKPTALNRMRASAEGEVLLMTDARQPLSKGATRALVEPLADASVGCVAGNLILEGEAGAGAYWRYEKWIRNAEARTGSMVGVSGALYAVRRADVAELPADTILDDMWIPLRLRLQGRRIVFRESARAFDRAFDDEREFGRKVRTLAGNFQLMARMPRLLVPFQNPSWFAFVSHKVMRLVCPWALAALLVASIGGELVSTGGSELTVLRVLSAGQLLFYLLAAAGASAGRLGTLARTFVVLNAAAVVALWRHATSSQRITW